jgi:hypothetical protein
MQISLVVLGARRVPESVLRRSRGSCAGGSPPRNLRVLIVLRQQLPFSRAPLQALAALAHRSDEVSVAGGSALVQPGELASGSWTVIEGALRAQRRTLGPGSAIGLFETLAGTHHEAGVEALAPWRLLCVGSTAILDAATN